MKALIWVCCLTINYIVSSIGNKQLSLLPLSGSDSSAIIYGLLKGICIGASTCLFITIAIVLCAKLEWRRAMEKVAESGMSITEYAKQGLSEDFLQSLPRLTYEKMKSTLKAEALKGNITEAQRVILLKMCSWKSGEDAFPKI